MQQWLLEQPKKVNKYRGGKASLGHRSFEDGTALHWAVLYGQLGIAQLLLDEGAGMSYFKSNQQASQLI